MRKTPQPRNRGRDECRRLYPDPLGMCEGRLCTEPAVDRHHRDRNTSNNIRSNVQFLCRKCHKAEHGQKHKTPYVDTRQDPKPCVNCGSLAKPLRKGRCKTCHRYLTVRGIERPYRGDGRSEKVKPPQPCHRCKRDLNAVAALGARGLCNSCYTITLRYEKSGGGKVPEFGKRPEPPQTCPKGHSFDKENTGLNKRGQRYCRTCHRENQAKRNAAKRKPKPVRTHCKNGHLLDDANTYTPPGTNAKQCRICDRERRGQYKKNPAPQTHCKRGHEFTPENTRVIPAGKYGRHSQRQCRECDRLRHKDRARPLLA